MRVENAFPAIVSQQEFRRITRSLRSKAPARVNPRRASSPYLLSGLVKCEKCGKALTAAEAKSGKYSYYVCHSLLKKGRGTCKTPRLNSKRFEKLMIEQIRANILTESNIRDLVRLMDEEMDGVAAEQRERLENIEAELIEVRRRLDRVWHVIENSELDISDATSRIREHRERQEKLEIAAEEARALLSERRAVLDNVDTIAAFAEDMSDFLMTSEITESRAFIKSFVKEIKVKPGKATVYYTLPTPPDSPIGGGDAAEVALHGPVRSSVHVGGPTWMRTHLMQADPILLLQRLPQHLHRVLGAAAGAVGDLVAAGHAGDDDASLRRGAHRREQPLLSDCHGDVVVLTLVAEGARHAAAADSSLFQQAGNMHETTPHRVYGQVEQLQGGCA